MNITYGNREGQYFIPRHFETLADLLERIHVGPCPPRTEVLEIENPEIWYDAHHDYHHLKFTCRGRTVDVRLYKVFGVHIDGEQGWSGCPQNLIWDYAVYLRKQLGVVVQAA